MAPTKEGHKAFKINPLDQFARFLIIGGGTATHGDLTSENAKNAISLIKSDGHNVVAMIANLRKSGRIMKNESAMFAFALVWHFGALDVKQYAAQMFNDVIWTGTDLFQFLKLFTEMHRHGGKFSIGTLLGQTITKWYTGRSDDKLAMQLVKYQSREGFSHRDVMRLVRPKIADQGKNTLIKWAVKGYEDGYSYGKLIEGFEAAKRAKDAKTVATIIKNAGLPREGVPTEYLNAPEVWEALLPEMGYWALLRNLNKLTSVGLLTPRSTHLNYVLGKLNNEEEIKGAKLHPIKYLIAQKQYAEGHGEKGSMTWTPVKGIVDAIESAFYSSFSYSESSNKNVYFAADVSGSMSWKIPQMPILTPAEIAGVMILVSLKSGETGWTMGFSHTMTNLDIRATDKLDMAVKKIHRGIAGSTDPSVAIKDAANRNLPVDGFVFITDNDMNTGMQPQPLLEQFRRTSGRNTRAVVMSTHPVNYTILAPDDPLNLELVAFDPEHPGLIADFIAGRF